jgi:Cu(I)/Ag(I) efflux system membrane fusion protein
MAAPNTWWLMARRKLRLRLLAAAALVSGIAVMAAVFAVQSRHEPVETPPAAYADEAGVWYCPMHAHVTSDHEGSCPICGMKLVKRSGPAPSAHGNEHMAERMAEHMDEVFVAPHMQERLSLVMESVEQRDFSPAVDVAAEVVADESRVVTLSPKVEGWIERLGVSVVGQAVRAGQVLYEIYSPELQERQKGYIDLLTRRDSLLEAKSGAGGMSVGNSQPDLMLASVARERYRVRTRLLAADVPASVVDDLERFRRVHDVIPVLAAHDGVVTAIGAREGAYVRPGEIVVSYADQHAAWAEVILTPDVLGQLRSGDELELQSTLSREASVTSRLDPALAVIDPTSRTARLRVPLGAGATRFLPGTILDGRIRMQPRRALTIPADSVLRTGRGDFVIVSESENHFRQAQVHLGMESGDRVEVLDGLSPGQAVVTNGQFMLSAESSLQSSWRRFAAAERSTSRSP